jgi:hypothetical protein
MVKVKQLKPASTSTEDSDCKYDSDQEAAYFGLADGVKTLAFTEVFDSFGMPSVGGDRLSWIRESKLFRSVLSGTAIHAD